MLNKIIFFCLGMLCSFILMLHLTNEKIAQEQVKSNVLEMELLLILYTL